MATPPGLTAGTPAINDAGKYHFTGRSDGFAAGLSTNPNNARLDPEGLRVGRWQERVRVLTNTAPIVPV